MNGLRVLVIEPGLRTAGVHYAEFVRALGARGGIEVYAIPPRTACWPRCTG
jgi:hypothetical protein